MSKSIKYQMRRVKNYSLNRISQSIIHLLGKATLSIQHLEKRELSYEGQKAQSMARVYVTAACLELEKMIKAEHSHKSNCIRM